MLTATASGVGIPLRNGALSLSGALVFGDVNVGGNRILPMRIANVGDIPVTITRFEVPDGFSLDWQGGILPPGAVRSVEASFSPQAERPYAGTIEVVSDQDEFIGQKSIGVHGTGIVEPAFELLTQDGQPGLIGTYFNFIVATRSADWPAAARLPVVGTRRDEAIAFTTSTWGKLSEVGFIELQSGRDEDWSNFSVQWDGVVKINKPVKLALPSTDSSWLWIDLDGDGFESHEVTENDTGPVAFPAVKWHTPVLQPGNYPVRIQYFDVGAKARSVCRRFRKPFGLGQG